MKSKFRFWAYFATFLSVSFTALMLTLVLKGNAFNPKTPLLIYIIATLFFSFVWYWLVFGELRLKAIFIHLEFQTLIIRRYLGLSTPKTYYLDSIDGYKTSILSSNSGSYEYLYLMKRNKRIATLSEYYHANYQELKQYVIAQNSEYLGFERFSYIRDLKEMFKNSTA